MAFALTEKGRKAFFEMSEGAQKKVAEMFARRNRLRPDPEDERTLFQKTKEIGVGLGKSLFNQAEKLEEERVRRGTVRTFGSSLLGVAKGVARLPLQIGAGAREFRGLLGAHKTDAKQFIERARFQRAQDTINEAIPLKGASQQLGGFIGAEGTLGLLTGGAATSAKLRHLPRIARAGVGGGLEAGAEFLRTGSPAVAAVAGIAGGAASAIPASIAKQVPQIAKKEAATLGIASRSVEDPILTWLKSAGIPGDVQLRGYGKGGEAASEMVESLTFRIGRVSEEIDRTFGRDYRKLRGRTLSPEGRKFLETGVVTKGLDQVELGWLQPLKEIWHPAREAVFDKFGKALKIGRVADYLPRKLSVEGKEILFASPKDAAVGDLVRSGWKAKSAGEFVDEIRAPANRSKSVEQILQEISRPSTKRGRKGFTKARKLQQLPYEWLENDVPKLFDSYFDDVATEVAAIDTVGKNGENLTRALNNAVNEGGMPERIRESLVEALYRPGVKGASRFADVTLSISANLNLRNAYLTGTVSELAAQTARTGGVNELVALSREIADTITGKSAARPVSRGATTGLAATEGAVGSDIITRFNPFLVTFRKMQSFVDRVNTRAARQFFSGKAKKFADKPMGKAEEARFRGHFGNDAFETLFDETKKIRPEFLKEGGEDAIGDIAAAANLAKTKPLSPLSRPLLWQSSPLFRMATQFKSFMFPTTRSFLVAITKGTPTQIAGSMASLVGWGTAVGLVIDKGKDLMDRVLRGEEATKEDIDYVSTVIGAIASSLDKSGAISLFSDQLRSAKFAKKPEELLGRTVAGPVGVAMGQIVLSPLMNIAKGDVDDIGRKWVKGVMKSTSIGRDAWIRFGENQKEKSARDAFIKRKEQEDSDILKKFFPDVKAARDGGEPIPEIEEGDAIPTETPTSAFEFIKGFEGFESTAFDDAGEVSIGFGTRAQGRENITEEEAQEDAESFIADLQEKIDEKFPDLGENQRIALASFMFNLGPNPKGADKLFTAIEEGDEETVREEWVKFNKARASKGEPLKVLRGLTKRRQQEVDLFFA